MKLTAMILAGGKGSRLEPWGAPKCLLPISGVPILHRILAHVGRWCDDVIVCVGYRASDVAHSIRTVRAWDHVRVHDAGEDATMCARILDARALCMNERILVLYGDELGNVSVPALMARHEQLRAEATVTVYNQLLPFGVADYKDGFLRHIADDVYECVNIGFAVLEPSALAKMNAGEQFSAFLSRIAGGGMNVGVYVHEGGRATINSPADIAKAEEVWR